MEKDNQHYGRGETLTDTHQKLLTSIIERNETGNY